MEPPDDLTVDIIGGTVLTVGQRVHVVGRGEGDPLRLEPDPDGRWVITSITAFLHPSTGIGGPIPSTRITLRRTDTMA